MKLKKLFASVLAIALAAAAVPATTVKADTIEGQAAYLNTEVYQTVLPTTASQKFYLDPQGLSGVASGSPSDVPVDPEAGQIVGKTTMSAINLSSRAVKMDVTYVLDVDSNDMTVESTTSAAIAATATKPAICLVVSAKNNGTKAVSANAIALAPGATDSVTAVASGTALNTNGTGKQEYDFAAASYQVVTKNAIDINDKDALYDPSNYDYKRMDEGASIELEIGGTCSKAGDYSAFTGANAKSLNLNMTFKFTKADGSDVGPDLNSATDTGAVALDDPSIQVMYISAPGVETSSINYFIDGTLGNDSSQIFNNGTYIGVYYSTLYNGTNHCVMTYEYNGTLYKQTMW